MADKKDDASTQTFENKNRLEHSQQEAPGAKPLTTTNTNVVPQLKPRPRD
jgi:hypothetical protein